jgi:imidazole glycerol-phosphate synthase subunit HisH
MIGIVYYGAGNIFSLTAALDRLGLSYGMIHHIEDFEKYDRYIIPGVGHAGTAMQKLKDSGLIPSIIQQKKPVLGICVGMQLLSDHSEEGNSNLTGIISLETKLFSDTLQVKVPHTGWNKVFQNPNNPLFKDIPNGAHFYFVHSYFLEFNSNYTIAATEYGIKFSAAIQRDNFYGVQFHPEKSGIAGEQLIRNFAQLN